MTVSGRAILYAVCTLIIGGITVIGATRPHADPGLLVGVNLILLGVYLALSEGGARFLAWSATWGTKTTDGDPDASRPSH